MAGDRRNEAEVLVTVAEAKIRICESRGGGAEVNTSTLEIAEMAVESVMKTRPHDLRVLAPALLIYSTALSHTGRARSALVAATDAKIYFQTVGNHHLAVKAMLLMAEAEVNVGWPGKGIETADKAYKNCEELNDYDGQEDALVVIDRACEALKLPTRADRRKEAEEEAKKMQEQRQQMAAMAYYQQTQGQLQAPPPAVLANQAARSTQMQEVAQDAPKQPPAAFKRDADPLLMKSGMSVEVVREKVNQIAASIIGGDDDYEADTPLMEAGLTSNTAVLLRDELTKDLPGIKLPPTLIFDYPSVVAISDFVIEQSQAIAG
jgi:acyl carrier protein